MSAADMGLCHGLFQKGSVEVKRVSPTSLQTPEMREVKPTFEASNFTSLHTPGEGSREVKSPPLKGGKGNDFPSLPLHGGTTRDFPSMVQRTDENETQFLRRLVSVYIGVVSRWCDKHGCAQAGECIAGARSVLSTKAARELAALELSLVTPPTGPALDEGKPEEPGEDGNQWSF